MKPGFLRRWLRLGIASLAAVLVLPVSAAETEEESGAALARELRNLEPQEDSVLAANLEIRRPKSRREIIPITVRVENKKGGWETIYEVRAEGKRPPEKLIVIHANNQPNLYWYAKGSNHDATLPKLETLKPGQTRIGFAGSDFSLSDLGLEFYHWSGQRQKKGEMRKGQSCHVLESLNSEEGAQYARVISWVDKDSGGVLIAEAYDAKNRLAKVFSVKSVEKVDGKWKLDEMEIRTVATATRTLLKFDHRQSPP